MGRRKNKPVFLENLRVEAMAAEGKCIAKHEDKVIFLPYTAPGDVVDVRLTKNRKSYAEGTVLRWVEKSADRIEAKCEHYGTCGGCKWQHISYDDQLNYKHQQVLDNLQRIGHLPVDKARPMIGSTKQWNYRNKLEFTATPNRWLTNEEIKTAEEGVERRGLGFHVPGAFDKILNVHECHLQGDFSNKIRNFIRDKAMELDVEFYNIREHEGALRNVIVRSAESGELMVIVQFGRDRDSNLLLMEAIKIEFPSITSLLYIINSKGNETFFDQEVIVYSGKDHMIEHMPLDDTSEEILKFKIGPKSFYQTNATQAFELYKVTRELAEIESDEIVYDLYTGTGTIANFVANKAAKVVGVEYVDMAIEDAKINSELNNVQNTAFYAGDMKDVLSTAFVEENGHPTTMIVDPPRAGMHPDVVKTILNVSPEKIVYVSCNSATQARDIEMMHEHYKIDVIQVVDMFPQTHHSESVVRLTRR